MHTSTQARSGGTPHYHRVVTAESNKPSGERRRRLKNPYEGEDPAAIALYSKMGKWGNGIAGAFFGVASVVIVVAIATAEPGSRTRFVWPLVLSLAFVGLAAHGFFRGKLQGPKN